MNILPEGHEKRGHRPPPPPRRPTSNARALSPSRHCVCASLKKRLVLRGALPDSRLRAAWLVGTSDPPPLEKTASAPARCTRLTRARAALGVVHVGCAARRFRSAAARWVVDSPVGVLCRFMHASPRARHGARSLTLPCFCRV